jgi:hypothetical protein
MAKKRMAKATVKKGHKIAAAVRKKGSAVRDPYAVGMAAAKKAAAKRKRKRAAAKKR